VGDDIKMDLKDALYVNVEWINLAGIGPSGGMSWRRLWKLVFHKRRGMVRTAEWLL